jgi:hypothetical protein
VWITGTLISQDFIVARQSHRDAAGIDANAIVRKLNSERIGQMRAVLQKKTRKSRAAHIGENQESNDFPDPAQKLH